MSSYKELIEKREELERQIKDARAREIAGAIANVRALVSEFDLKPQDVFPSSRRTGKTGNKVAPKYRNPATGETWTGRGKAPRWIDNKDRTQFLIKP